jgi:hypothetical protein
VEWWSAHRDTGRFEAMAGSVEGGA